MAIDVISSNIKRNVKYIYYAPDTDSLNADFETLKRRIKEITLTELQKTGYNEKLAQEYSDKMIQDHVLIFHISNEDEFLYNFSYLVTPDRVVTSAWYLSDQDSESTAASEEDNSVLLIELTGREPDDLKKVIRTILKADDTTCTIGATAKKDLINTSILFK